MEKLIGSYITFDQAVALKGLYYNKKCNAYYWVCDKELEYTNRIVHEQGSATSVVMAPKKNDVIDWLRDKYGYVVCIVPAVRPNIIGTGVIDLSEVIGWNSTIFYINNGKMSKITPKKLNIHYETYDDCLSAVIDEILKLIYETNLLNVIDNGSTQEVHEETSGN